MSNVLGGLVMINGTDIWTKYGAFLVEDRRGGHDNMSAILTPSAAKKDVAVNIREENGEKYSAVLKPRNEARDVELHFAIYNETKKGWMEKYFAFINMLKTGVDGWLNIKLTDVDITIRVKYVDAGKFTPLTYLAKEGVQAGKFKVKFREPNPIL